MPDEEINVSALLRIKRYEVPPPGYFDKLLQDIHRRQRSELLRRPLWKIAAERVQTFFSEHSMGGASYAGAMAVVVAVGVAAIGLMAPGDLRSTGPEIAEHRPVAHEKNLLSLQEQQVSLALPEASRLQPASPHPVSIGRTPRYVIDTRPVSYDAPPSL